MEDEKKITLYEDDLYNKKEAAVETVQLVVFRLSSEWYGVEITKAREVIEAGRITYLPSSPAYIAGIISLRGNILSVTDLKKLFGLPPEELTELSRIVVVESGTLETGLLVDEVAEVAVIPKNRIDPALATLSHEKAEYLEGECRFDNKLMGVLRVENILKKRIQTDQ